MLGQVVPVRVHGLNQANLFAAAPAFDLFLAINRNIWIGERLVIDRAIGADLRNGRVGLFQKDGIHAAVQRVGEDGLIVITLIGEKNCVAGGIGGSGEERNSPSGPLSPSAVCVM